MKALVHSTMFIGSTICTLKSDWNLRALINELINQWIYKEWVVTKGRRRDMKLAGGVRWEWARFCSGRSY
jgi:hypothetical protein